MMVASFTLEHGLIALGLGLVILALIMLFGFRRLFTLQRDHMNRVNDGDIAMQKREKIVLASALANELTENKFKCEAFITIYTELLRNLRDGERRALYEDTGDFIHQHAPLSRTVYDQNIDKLFLFGPKLVADLTQVYGAVRTEPQYFTLDQAMPRPSAIRIVEMVLDDAQKTLEPMDPAIAALNIIVRDGAKRDEAAA